MVCPWCDFYFPLEAEARVTLLSDRGCFNSLASLPSGPTLFGWTTVLGRPLALVVGDPNTRWTLEEARTFIALLEEVRARRRPLLWAVTAAYGAADVLPWPGLQAALNQLQEAELPWIALMSGPCYGAMTALALQADFVLAEPGTVVSLRPAESLRGSGHLPVESRRSPRQLLGEGWADMVVARQEQRRTLAGLLDLLGLEGQRLPGSSPASRQTDPVLLPLDALELLCDPVLEVHGDRCHDDDPALVGALARLRSDGTRLLVLITARGRGWHEVRRRHKGAIAASGWRKATRLLHLAARFELPVLILLGTPGLHSGRRAQPATLSAALGETLQTLLALPVPSVTVYLGGGEGLPLLALSATDRLLATESSVEQLAPQGLVPGVTFGEGADLSSILATTFKDLQQTYALQGPLGRRKLLQHRYTRWARLALSLGDSTGQETRA